MAKKRNIRGLYFDRVLGLKRKSLFCLVEIKLFLLQYCFTWNNIAFFVLIGNWCWDAGTVCVTPRIWYCDISLYGVWCDMENQNISRELKSGVGCWCALWDCFRIHWIKMFHVKQSGSLNAGMFHVKQKSAKFTKMFHVEQKSTKLTKTFHVKQKIDLIC